MKASSTDRQLLWRYLSQRSEEAFEALVRRHADLVFSTALRRLGNDDSAREVTQSVFVALGRKAWRLTGEESLAGWLHKAAVLESRRWWRDELRRQRREQTAINLGTTMKEESSPLESLSPVLDEALFGLKESERQAVMLRFFENLSHREVGMRLGVGEDAARKRIDKGLAHLTRFFRRRGYTVPTTATAALVMTHAVRAAPEGLVNLAAKAGLAISRAGWLAGLGLLVVRFFALRKMSTAAIALVLCVAPLSHQWLGLRTEQARQRSLQERLTRLESDRGDLERLISLIQTRLLNTEALLVNWHSRSNEENLYTWDDSDYVRVPKKMDLPRAVEGGEVVAVAAGYRRGGRQ